MRAKDLYTQITNRVIEHLKEGVPPWVRCWKGGSVLPHNAITGREYTGINSLILGLTALKQGYEQPAWLTYQQANALKAHVRKGEKATPVVFVKFIEQEENDKKVQRPVYKVFHVFNRNQIEGLPPEKVVTMEPPTDGEEKALELMKGTGAKFIYGGDRAFYSVNRDEITLPPYGSFTDDAGFYGTALHELAHWSGHKDRLNRQYGKRFGDKAYAYEELVAELSSAYMCARLGIPATFRSAQYIQSWVHVLENDERAILSAASYATHAADYLWEKGFHEVNEHTPAVEAQGLAAE